MLAAPCDTPPKEAIVDGLREGLQADPRVSEVEFTDQRLVWMRRQTFYPASREPNEDELLSGSDHFHNVVLSDPVTFIVKVPKKNQPEFMGYSDHPADTYFVAWDGRTATVGWEVKSDIKTLPHAGGQVVVEVLNAAARHAGVGLYVQACSPGCKNLFMHGDVLLVQVSSATRHSVAERRGPRRSTVVEAPVAEGSLDAVDRFANWMRGDCFHFAAFKNYSQRLVALDQVSHRMVEELLRIQYRRTTRSAMPWWRRVLTWRPGLADRARARKLVSGIWLAAARHEALLTEWHEFHDDFTKSVEERSTRPMFEADFDSDERAVQRQDLGFITNAVSHTASRLDARLVAIVTLVAALGGIVGALLAAAMS